MRSGAALSDSARSPWQRSELPQLVEHKLREGEDILVPDSRTTFGPEWEEAARFMDRHRLRAACLSPVWTSARPSGVVMCFWAEAQPELAAIIPALRLLGWAFGDALARAQLNRELSLLRRVEGFALRAASELGDLTLDELPRRMQPLMKELVAALRMDACSLLCIQHQQTQIMVSYTEDGAEALRHPPAWCEAPLRAGELVIRQEAPEHPDEPQAILLAPVLREGSGGGLYLAGRAPNPRLDEVRHVISLLADLFCRAWRQAQSTRALHERELRLRSFMEGVQDAIYVVDMPSPISLSLPPREILQRALQARLSDCNAAFLALIGRQREEVLGLSTEELRMFPRDDRVAIGEAALANGFQLRGAEVVQEVRGEPRTFLRRIQGVIEDQHLVRAWGIISDVTEQRRTEAALLATQRRLESAIDGSQDGLWEWPDLRTDTAWWSPRLREMLQLPELAPSRSAFARYLSAGDEERLAAAIERHLEHHAPFELDVTATPPKARLRLRLRGRVIERSGARVRMAGSITDISARTVHEEELRRAQRLESLGLLAGGVAHDFNNILTAVSTLATLAREEVGVNPREALSCLEQIQGLTDRAAGLTRQLLAFSRRQTSQRRPLSLGVLFGDLVKMLRRLLPASIELRFLPTEAHAMVDADPGQLEQALINLCVNAADAMPNGGMLTIEIKYEDLAADALRRHPSAPPGHYARVIVTDTGHGMPHEVVERAFEPFFTTKSPGKGTGLGLAMVYVTIQEHAGFIDLHSEPGHGTTVEFCLPVLERPPEQPAPASLAKAARGSEQILLAEDEPAVRNLLVRLLSRRGYRVTIAADGEEAIRLFDADPGSFDLFFLDAIMPKANGRQVHDHIIARRPKARFVFSSGYAAGLFPSGFFDDPHRTMVAKPYDVDDLLRALREMIDRPLP